VPQVNKNLFHNPKEVFSQVCLRQLPVTDSFQIKFLDLYALNLVYEVDKRLIVSLNEVGDTLVLVLSAFRRKLFGFRRLQSTIWKGLFSYLVYTFGG
jgi:translation elongation factor EF-4